MNPLICAYLDVEEMWKVRPPKWEREAFAKWYVAIGAIGNLGISHTMQETKHEGYYR